jgi:hypothetical protein
LAENDARWVFAHIFLHIATLKMREFEFQPTEFPKGDFTGSEKDASQRRQALLHASLGLVNGLHHAVIFNAKAQGARLWLKSPFIQTSLRLMEASCGGLFRERSVLTLRGWFGAILSSVYPAEIARRRHKGNLSQRSPTLFNLLRGQFGLHHLAPFFSQVILASETCLGLNQFCVVSSRL